jgi:hypothetical protein
MTHYTHQNTLQGNLSREIFVELLETALRVGEHRFARQAALSWQTQYPGDLYVSLLQAKAYAAGSGNPGNALAIVQHLVSKDPFFLKAYEFGLEISSGHNQSIHQFLGNSCYAAGGQKPAPDETSWGTSLRAARAMLQEGKLDLAESALLEVIAENPPSPLPAITHLELLQAQARHSVPGNELVHHKIIEHYHLRWENCLEIRLFFAEALMDSGVPEKGVALLHDVVAEDITGQVIRRLWGAQHPYLKLWPEHITGTLDAPIPASIAAWFGWNLLEDRSLRATSKPGLKPSGKQNDVANASNGSSESHQDHQDRIQTEISSSQPDDIDEPSLKPDHETLAGAIAGGELSEQTPVNLMPETLLATQAALDDIAVRINRSEITRSDGRFPVYILLTSQANLIQQYGKEGYLSLAAAMLKFQKIIDRRPNWRAFTLYVDDPQTTASIGLKPVKGTDPWAIKKLLADLDRNLSRRGEMIGALLIVGGPQIIPFHLLPNPVDDVDAEIPSDNPYGCIDDNYFVPEWPVGRFPGDASNDIRPLIASLQASIDQHAQNRKAPNWLVRNWEWLLTTIQKLFHMHNSPQTSMGYTAAIWRKASEATYSPLGDHRSMLISPPSTALEYRKIARSPHYAYFNLHGILESADWYGHNDPINPLDGPDYPVALQLSDIRSPSWTPQIVFSEACYGAWITERTIDQAIPLRMLSLGTSAFVGSTATAYGAVETPLIAADLLGNYFWKHLKQGAAVGEALRRAKIDLIQEMDQRQGYLDGEDQKTLIEFILYGDPLLNPAGMRRVPKEILRPLEKPEIHTVCEKLDAGSVELPMTEETLRTVKRVVRQYLPGIGNAQVSINAVHPGCKGKGHNCPSAQLHLHQKSISAGEKQVVVISKQIQNATEVHYQFARLTLDRRGKIVKLSVSR